MTNEAFLKVGGTTDLLDTTTVTQDDGEALTRAIVEPEAEHISATTGLAFTWASTFATGGGGRMRALIS